MMAFWTTKHITRRKLGSVSTVLKLLSCLTSSLVQSFIESGQTSLKYSSLEVRQGVSSPGSSRRLSFFKTRVQRVHQQLMNHDSSSTDRACPRKLTIFSCPTSSGLYLGWNQLSGAPLLGLLSAVSRSLASMTREAWQDGRSCQYQLKDRRLFLRIRNPY